MDTADEGNYQIDSNSYVNKICSQESFNETTNLSDIALNTYYEIH